MKSESSDAAPWMLPKSMLPNAVWPAIPRPEGAIVISLMRQLEDTQWWAPEKLKSFQFAQLTLLLRHAYATCPYYQQRFAGFGIDHHLPVEENWARLPVLTRRDIQTDGQALRSLAPPEAHGPGDVIQTSGSTGEPIAVYRSGLNSLMWTVFTLRDHLWHGRDMSRKLVAMRSVGEDDNKYPEGKTGKGWGQAARIFAPDAPTASLALDTPADKQLEWLIRQNPEYILTLPSNLKRIAELAIEQRVKLPKLRTAITISEIVYPELRQTCWEAFGIAIQDIYSSREMGYIALQCPEGEHYHVQAEGVFLEVLDDDGAPVREGEIGRIVVTNLHNFVMPLIRYALGDYAEVGPACPCGRGLPVLNRIVGRVQNTIVLPSGGRMFPQIAKFGLHEIAPVRQHQIVQTALEDLEVRLVVGRSVTSGEEEMLRKALAHHMGHSFNIALKYVDEIALGPGGKHQDFISKIVQEP